MEKTLVDRMEITQSDAGENMAIEYPAGSVFAEMYLEDASKAKGITCTACTYRGIPTIDDF